MSRHSAQVRGLASLLRFSISAAVLSIVLACSLGQAAGMFEKWNTSLGDARMEASPLASRNDIVFVAVDTRSLAEIGTWPWSRSVHAAIVTALAEADARDIFLDFDFTFSSDEAGDRAFETALEHAGGATLLPVFEQPTDVTPGATRHLNSPLPRFADRGWPVLVNVGADARGLVRHYPFGAEIDGAFVPSAAAFIANRMEQTPDFEINFALRPHTITTVSATDVIGGTVPPEVFTGRSVVVGASAVELSDRYAVPLHGIVPGPLIHAMAAETLSRDLVPTWLRWELVSCLLLMQLLVLKILVGRSVWLGLGSAVSFLAAAEIMCLILFREDSIQVPTAMLYPGLIGFSLGNLATRLIGSERSLIWISAEARNTLRQLSSMFDNSGEGIVILSDEGAVVRCNQAAQAIFGADVEGRIVLPPQLMQAALLSNVGTGESRSLEIGVGQTRRLVEWSATTSEIERPDFRRAGTGLARITTVVARDVTQVREQERAIAYLSRHDERTGALRRGAFLDLMQALLDQGTPHAVFVLSLVRFKTINVTLGRRVGDTLLQALAARLAASDIGLATFARVGGTRFALLSNSEIATSEPSRFAERLREVLSVGYHLEDADAEIDIRVGYGLAGESGATEAATLLEQAEEALDRARELKAPHLAFDGSAWDRQRRAREIERIMERALEDHEFQLVYQPQHRVADGVFTGAEALLRWTSSSLGQIFPDEFIGIAEATGFINDLGRWVLARGAEDAFRLPQHTSVAVNVSGVQIMRGDFSNEVDAVLSTTGLAPERLCLELTESVLMTSTDSIVETMNDLRFSGVTWALDDFGTGFSSMQYLSRMPLSKIKLDRAFTMRINDDPAAPAILHATRVLSRGLGIGLLCEGVETQAHFERLRIEGCDEAQGYLFGKPMPLDDLVAHVGHHVHGNPKPSGSPVAI